MNPNLARGVYLKYTIKDLETMYTHTGVIELGAVNPLTELDDNSIIHHVTQWMGSSQLQGGPLHQYIQYWNIPPAQDLVVFKFSTSSTITDISANLRIPRGQLSDAKCLLSNQRIEIHPRPLDTTPLA